VQQVDQDDGAQPDHGNSLWQSSVLVGLDVKQGDVLRVVQQASRFSLTSPEHTVAHRLNGVGDDEAAFVSQLPAASGLWHHQKWQQSRLDALGERPVQQFEVPLP
jgi:hypothetical protein